MCKYGICGMDSVFHYVINQNSSYWPDLTNDSWSRIELMHWLIFPLFFVLLLFVAKVWQKRLKSLKGQSFQ